MKTLLSVAVLVLLVAGCQPTPTSAPSATATTTDISAAPVSTTTGADAAPALQETDWKLVEMRGAPLPGPRLPTLQLAVTESRASGDGSCNRFFGGYELKAETIRFSRLASTMMACADTMEQERNYLAALAEVTAWRIKAARLELLQGNTVVLTFEPANAEAQP
ncbi:MAG: META domain-containing protein [Moraxellaceae bacterium]|nr:META domain-containing protein [Moraxellaceae bacterium]